MNSVSRLFIGNTLVKRAFGVGPGLAKMMQPPKRSPDLGEYLSNEDGNWNLNAFDPSFARPHLSQYNPAFTNNLHSLMINSHGGEGRSGFSMQSQPWPAMTDSRDSSEKPVMYPAMPRFNFNLPQVAKTMGPATNNIHNLFLRACQSGGCAPEEAMKLFPNLTNVVGTAGPTNSTTAGEWFNAMNEGANNLYSYQKGPTNMLTHMPTILKKPFNLNAMLGRTPSAPPVQPVASTNAVPKPGTGGSQPTVPQP